jgi:hypothetical protein
VLSAIEGEILYIEEGVQRVTRGRSDYYVELLSGLEVSKEFNNRGQ